MLHNLSGQLSDSAKTQSGSKFLQQQLAMNDGADGEIVTYVLARVEHDLPDVVVDMFGNYFVQALFRSASDAQRETILRSLAPSLVDIACDRNGTYALQVSMLSHV
jgi:hypothetical protein